MNPALLVQAMLGLLGLVQQVVPSGKPAEQQPQPQAQSGGVDLAAIAALVAAMRAPEAPLVEPQKPPLVLSILAIVLPAATVAAMFGLVYAVATPDRAGELIVALSISMGVLLTLTASVVQWFAGSSIGSWTKNFRAPVGGPGAAIVPPSATPTPTSEPDPEPQPQPELLPPDISGVGPSTDQSTATTRSDVPTDGRPASVRYNNPGAQYPSTRAASFGQLGYGIIGGGHKIARFPHPVNGAASNFDLLSRSYTGMTFGAAGKKWTGSNGFGIPGYDDNTFLTTEMVADQATAIPIMKAIAQREAGKKNTLTDVQWQAAHAMFLAGSADAWIAQHHTAAPDETDRKNASGSDIVALAKTRVGEKYVNVQVPKDDPNWHGPWDCAEFASWLVYQTAGILYGCTDDTTDPAKADAYTGSWKTDAATKGRLVPVSEAAGTPGAFLLRYPPAPGEMGHIAVSDGQGGTVEAAGSSTGVVSGKVSGRRWDTGVLVPGIDYSGGSVHVTGPAKIYAVGQPNMDAAKVKEIQTALAAHGYSPGDVDGEYGTTTALAAAAFQKAQGLISDGEVGPDTAKALGVTL